MGIIENLQKIMSARYGKDVRQAIHDSISDMNEVANQAYDSAIASQNSASASASEARASATSASESASSASASASSASESASSASASEANASASATSASESASSASASASEASASATSAIESASSASESASSASASASSASASASEASASEANASASASSASASEAKAKEYMEKAYGNTPEGIEPYINSVVETKIGEATGNIKFGINDNGDYGYFKDESFEPFAKEEVINQVTGTLAVGETSITLSHEAITTDSDIDIYTDIYGVCPRNVTVQDGQITLEFKAQANSMNIKVVIL